MLSPEPHTINVALVGVGNCASSLVQGLQHYGPGNNDPVGLMHPDIGGYQPGDISVVAAWDIDKRKIGRDVAEAIFAPPNCTTRFCERMEPTGTRVRMGRVLDGVADHMADFPAERSFRAADAPQPEKDEVVEVL